MSIADNIAHVEEQVNAVCRGANRPPSSVRLMAVSKTHPAESILEAYASGIRLFGENRVQEYTEKYAALLTAGILTAQSPASFHYIGPLQSNKASRAVKLFDAIDTVDSLRLAEKLDQAAKEAGKVLPVCVEIKLSHEGSKHGLTPDSSELDELFERLPDFSHLQTRGLMTVPPYAEDPEQARPYFLQLRLLRNSLAQRYPHMKLDELSMGMSHDFSVAIEEGSTMIRVGTAIFGRRSSA
jgi:pyridoxal phosphate enzyme (YggS family)